LDKIDVESFRTVTAERLLAWPNHPTTWLREAAEECLAPKVVVFTIPLSPTTFKRGNPLNQIVDQIIEVVIALYPAWLPGAEDISGPGGSGAAAVRALADELASKSTIFGQFLRLIADAALRQEKFAAGSIFAAEVVLCECHKLMLRTYSADAVLLVIELVPGLQLDQILSIQEAVTRLSNQSAFQVWMSGAACALMERITKSPLAAPFSSEASLSEKATPVLYITPLAGRPNPCSHAEKRLEVVLSRYAWARGRAWNQTWSTSVLHNPIRVDLIWQKPRCVIEIDGPDHLDPTKYATDRVRDRLLRLEGFAVLRFTNQEVLDDAEQVALQIGRFLTQTTE